MAVEWGDPSHLGATLHGEERTAVAAAVRKRQLEFANGRACARRALAQLGLEDASIPVGKRRQPLWPSGFVGSITHTGGFCAAVTARAESYRSVGIDAEPDEPLPTEVVGMVCTEAELRHGQALEPHHRCIADRLIFSAKEAVYKLQYPLAEAFVDFDQVAIELKSGVFLATLQVPIRGFSAGHAFAGRWGRGGGILVAATWLPS
jgi:4'-phosphopantetheinyl transferase EntD